MRSFDFKKSFKSPKKGTIKVLIPLIVLLFITLALPSFAQDATGANTGTISEMTWAPL